jgi:N6-adenosine-specific RNA methylase IME4
MPVPEIGVMFDLEIAPLLAKDAPLFVWMIDDFLVAGEQVFLDRGYTRHARIVWDKMRGIAPGFTVRYMHEYLIWFNPVPRRPIAPDSRGLFGTIIRERARQHSRKPDAAYAMVERLFPDTRRIDVFSREKRAGWDQYGDQIDHFGSRS